MRVSPVPYLIAEILASNIGGTATLIGDPPNILIGSAAGYDFGPFTLNMARASLLVFAGFLILAGFMFAPELARRREGLVIADLAPSGVITDFRMMRISAVVMLATIIGFVIAGPLGYEPATVALLGARGILLLARGGPAESLAVVEGVIRGGIIEAFANELFSATRGDVTLTILALLWVSGLASGIVDNIPYTATLIPVVQQLGARGVELDPLWWSLALGADLGGNSTIIGASANVITVSLAARSGHEIRFGAFLRYGIATVVLSLAIASLYVWVRYLL